MTTDKELEYAAESAYKKITGDGSTPISTELFKAGAQWQLNRVLGLLRGEEADKIFSCEECCWPVSDLADWLERQLTPNRGTQEEGGKDIRE